MLKRSFSLSDISLIEQDPIFAEYKNLTNSKRYEFLSSHKKLLCDEILNIPNIKIERPDFEFDTCEFFKKHLEDIESKENCELKYLQFLESKLLSNKKNGNHEIFYKFLNDKESYLDFYEWEQILTLLFEKMMSENISLEDSFNQLFIFMRVIVLSNSFKSFIIKELEKNEILKNETDDIKPFNTSLIDFSILENHNTPSTSKDTNNFFIDNEEFNREIDSFLTGDPIWFSVDNKSK